MRKKYIQFEERGTQMSKKARYVFLLLLTVICSLSSIKANNVQSGHLTFSVKDQSINTVMEAIEKQTGYTFFYDNSKIDATKKVTINCKDSSLDEILYALFKNTNIKSQIVEKNIVLSVSENTVQTKATTQSADKILNIKGVVIDMKGEPIIGASIRLANDKQQGTITDIDGNFSIKVPQNEAIEVASVGYKTQRLTIKNESALNVILEENNQVLQDVVVVGYGVQKRENLTGAVTSIDVAKQLGSRPITDIGRGLQGVPGLTITTTSGQIGNDPTFKIRGLGSLNGSSKPLILLDNAEISNISILNPDDIEDISILKDAAASSIYGSRAAFGVILLTSKKAKQGSKFNISYSTNLSWSNPTVVPEIVKSYEGAEMSWAAGLRVNPNLAMQENNAFLTWNLNSIERMKEWDRVYGGLNLSDEMVLGRDFDIIDGKPYFYRSFDAPEKFVNKNTFNQQHNASISGSSGNTTYTLNLGYFGQAGLLKVNPDKFNRYNVSFNTRSEVKKWLNVRSGLTYSRTNFETPFSYTSSTYNSWYYLYRWPRIMPYGTYQGDPFRNAVSEMEQANMNTRMNNYARINLGATAKLTKDISLDIDYIFSRTDRLTGENGGTVSGWDFWGGSGMVNHVWTGVAYDMVKRSVDQSDAHVTNIVGRWDKTINKNHKIGAMVGTNIEYYVSTGMTGSNTELIDPTKPEFNLANGENPTVSGYHSDWSVLGFFSRLNYSYKNRYLLEVNGRYDGSSRFPIDKLWGFFPSASAGYIISEEEFMEPTKSWLSFLKVRGSYGTIGNQDIGSNRFLPMMASQSSGWIIGDTPQKTFGLPRAIAEGFTWEKVTTSNIGFDTRYLNSDLGVSLDLFQRVTSDMVGAAGKLPSTFGTDAPEANITEFTNKGWELVVDYQHKFSNGLRMSVSANLQDAVVRYTKFASNAGLVSDLYKGKPIGEIWGFETDRFFTADDFDTDPRGKLVLKPDLPSQSYFEANWFAYGPGDIKYKDLNGDGVINRGNGTLADPGDQKVIGNSTPRYEYGARLNLEYKGFDFGVFVQGVGKRDLWASGSIFIPGFNYLEAWYTHQKDYWTPENPNAFYPRLSNLGQSNNSQNFLPQSKYLLNMAYCRLKNLSFGYTLPTTFVNKAQISKLRFYVSFENLFEFHNLGNMPIDPETGTTTGDGSYLGRSYPYARTASFGIQLTL